MKKHIRSRILENFEPSLLKEIYRICKSSVVSDNNLKVDTILNLLKQYKKDYIELGPGTNRLAILIDNYVFKIALDKWGMKDNLNEFTTSQELQPYVTKTYETNEIICVSEYVTVISVEEFEERKEEIRQILGILSEGYLLGDVGTVKKNFCNWGYRDNGDLVALDFAYIYRVAGDELLCSRDNEILRYDDNFHNLVCPRCGKKYTFMDIRRKIPMEVEERENFMAKELSYKVTKPFQEFEEKNNDEEDNSLSNQKELKEETKMKDKQQEKYEIPMDEDEMKEEAYYNTLEQLRQMKNKGNQHDIKDTIQEETSGETYCDKNESIEEDDGYDKESFRNNSYEAIPKTSEDVKEKIQEETEPNDESDFEMESGNIKVEIEKTEEVIISSGNSSEDIIKPINVISAVSSEEKEVLGVVNNSDDVLGVIKVNLGDTPNTNTIRVVSGETKESEPIKVIKEVPVIEQKTSTSTVKLFLNNTEQCSKEEIQAVKEEIKNSTISAEDEADALRKELEADLECDTEDEYEKMYDQADVEKNMGKRGTKKWDV